MPENCAFINCHKSRRYKGISLFKIPTPKTSDSDRTRQLKAQARSVWKATILRTRQETTELKERFHKNNIFLCEDHFSDDVIDSFTYKDNKGNEKVRKILQTGATPTLNLPTKSLDSLPGSSSDSNSRRTLVRHETTATASEPPTFLKLKQYLGKNYPYLQDWSVAICSDSINLELREPGFLIPKYFINITESLALTVAIYGAIVPDKSVLFNGEISVLCCPFKEFHSRLCNLNICCGISSVVECKDETFLHVIPLIPDKKLTSPINYDQTKRASSCEIVVSSKTVKCNSCAKLEEKKKKANPCQKPAKAKAPLSACSSSKLLETIREDRIKLKECELKCSQLEERLKRMQSEIDTHGITLEDGLGDSFLAILDKTNLQVNPHMRLVFQQQQKAMQSSKHGRRWHPHFVEFCLSIYAKSSSVYNNLRKSEKNPDGILFLPHERTLRDYRNHFKPSPGFVPENIDLLKSIVKDYTGTAKYIVLVFDEMKIKGRLVFDKYTGKLIGFTSLGDPELDFATFEELQLATHVLAFMIRGVQTTLKFTLAYFLTQTIVSYQLASIFWRAVAILELNCDLYVIATVSDGMSANRKFYRLHKYVSGLSLKDEKDKEPSDVVIFKSQNFFALQRFIWFFADAPHLMKTSRGNLHSSGSGGTRLLWNNGKNMVWEHISRCYFTDLELGLHQLPKLTLEHINLTSFAKMKVNLAVQVLSKSMAEALKRSMPPEVSETAQFCELMNNFFDCCNVRSINEQPRKQNQMLAPYKSCNDERFTWLTQTFIKYFTDWKQSVCDRPNFSKDEKARMFISNQTFEGLQITVNSLVECTKFLLSAGVPYVLTERFSQDYLEEYFGHQRQCGKRADNPDAVQFGYNDRTLQIQRNAGLVSRGNVGSRRQEGQARWATVRDEPLPKKKKVSKKTVL